MTTFISSWIFNFTEYKEFDPDLQKVSQRVGNQFPQLSWILPLLNKNESIFPPQKVLYWLLLKIQILYSFRNFYVSFT